MKLHSRLGLYFDEVEASLSALQGAYVEHYKEEWLTPLRANLRLRVRFENGRMLEINEAVVVEKGELLHLDYRYHCQDNDNQLVFRYDSTPHFPDLSTFPHHKHLPHGTHAAKRPNIAEVLAEAGGETE